MFRKVVPGITSRLVTVDHAETYGRHILDAVSKDLHIDTCVDLGCGHGSDLMIVKKHHPQARCVGVDLGDRNRGTLVANGVETISLDIESQPLPFGDESMDFIILNQVLEHTKEVFFINHEIFRTLKVGGHLFLGVPNVLSLHNRLLGLFGVHPTSAKMISGHVRVLSRKDVAFFYEQVAGGIAVLDGFFGSQFYPFPKRAARFLATAFPSLAVSIFFLIRKAARYDGQFVEWLSKAGLETNYRVSGA